MKKVLALVLAVVMALSVATIISADTLVPVDPAAPAPGITAQEETKFYGDDAWDAFWLAADPAMDFVTVDGKDAFTNAGNYSLSISGGAEGSVKISVATVKNDKNSAFIKVTAKPAAEKFTVSPDADKTEAKIVVVQKDKTVTDAVKATYTLTLFAVNSRIDSDSKLVWADANDKWTVDNVANNRVIDVSIFDAANGNPLAINYEKYSLNFPKVDKQNTSLYLFAKTGVVEGKAIASIQFQPTKVKDAMEVTMPISNDDENYYGETVWVYKVVNGKPSGEAIEGTVVNHNAVMFKVEAGTTLGAFAAYGDKAEGDAEIPAIPETGADMINVAIVFAVLALVATGVATVAKASK